MSGIPESPERTAAISSVLNSGTGSAATAPATSAPQAGGPDDLLLLVRGLSFGGWQEIRVVRSIEHMPNTFELVATEVSPLQPGGFLCKAGDPVQVKIGSDLVITGYVDRYSPSVSPEMHEVRIVGRSKSADLVDCNIPFMAGHQMAGGSLIDVVTKLCAPFGISVVNRMTTTPPVLPPFVNLMLSDTPFSIIERFTRYCGAIFYDLPDGNIVIGSVSKERAGSDLVLGLNIERAHATEAMDERYSEYFSFLQTYFNPGDEIPTTGNQIGHVSDPSVKRYRPRSIVSASMVANNLNFANVEAQWEKNRRFGRSFAVRVVTSTWRDGTGRLWEPNTLVGLDLPQLGIKPPQAWTAGDIIYTRGPDGTHCELVLMPSDAFSPEPVVLVDNPLANEVAADARNSGTGDAPKTPAEGGSQAAPAPSQGVPAQGSPGGSQGFGGVQGLPGSPSGPPARREPPTGI